jgi:hypothetical protein
VEETSRARKFRIFLDGFVSLGDASVGQSDSNAQRSTHNSKLLLDSVGDCQSMSRIVLKRFQDQRDERAVPGRRCPAVNSIDEIVYYDIVISMRGILMMVVLLTGSTRPGSASLAAAALKQRTQSFTIVLQGSVAEVTSLFGPVREAEWAPSWTPRFLHPPEGAQRDGVVFTTKSEKDRERLWLLTNYDVKAGRVEYVVITPELNANEIKVRVVPDGEKQCKATITYRHSALAPEGNKEVEKLDGEWVEGQRLHWEEAINSVLRKRHAHE